MILYIVIRHGVYRHEIGGVFSSKDLAIEAAKTLLLAEPDDHHDYEVLQVELDRSTWASDNELYPSYGSWDDGPSFWVTWEPRYLGRRSWEPDSKRTAAEIVIKENP